MASTIIAGNTTNSGTAISSDNTGALEIKTGSGAGTTALTIDSSQNVTAANNLVATGFTSASTFGFKNRIINGDMRIDQRNAGASVTFGAGTAYTLDRWFGTSTAANKFSLQQNAGAITPPVGFSNYLGITSLTSYSVSSSDTFYIQQSIEGFNTSDLSFGTANAATITLSFKVYSSLTGTFGGALLNSAANRSYPFSYSVPVSNTWTTISVTIAGDTTGTWIGATNGLGIAVRFGIGSGATYSGTAGAWATANLVQPTGSVSVVGTNGATFYITGVQLEKGSTATSFEYLDYGRSLMQCQRYFYRRSGAEYYSACYWQSTTQWNGCVLQYPVTMRAAPAFTFAAASNFSIGLAGGSVTAATIGASSISTNSADISGTVASGGTGNAGGALVGGASASISISAEL